MPRSLLLVYMLLLCVCAKGQRKDIDSLSSLLARDKRQDTIALQRLNDLAFYYYSINPDSGLIIAKKAIALAKAVNAPLKLASAYSNTGVNYNAKGDDKQALVMYDSAMQTYASIGNELGRARTFNNMAIVYSDISDYPKALACHRNALAVLTKSKDSVRMATSLSNIGVIYLRLSDYPRALDYYLKALNIYGKIQNTTAVANTLNNIGIIYKNLHKYDTAIYYYNTVIQIADSLGDIQTKALALANKGVVMDEMNKPSKAIELYLQALEINERIGNGRKISSDLTNIAVACKALGDYVSAYKYLTRAHNILKQLTDKNSLATVLDEIGDIYLNAGNGALREIGISATERYNLAIAMHTQSFELAKEIGAVDRQAHALEHLSSAFEAKGDYVHALRFFKQYKTLNDSIYSESKSAEISRIEVKHEYEKEQATAKANFNAQHAIAMIELRRQQLIKRFLIIGLIALTLGALWIFVFYKRSRDAATRKKEAEFRSKVINTEMKVLRLQMNPHFIFNSLNAIGDYIQQHNVDQASRYLGSFAKVMRMILESSEHREVTLAEDLAALRLYIQLEALRLSSSFTYEIIVDEDIDTENIFVPPLILQPFVENSIWHGLSGKKDHAELKIAIRLQNNMLYCTVADNGIGRAKHSLIANGQSKKSMATRITQARIDILNQNSDSNARLEIEDLEEGTSVLLILPLITDNDVVYA